MCAYGFSINKKFIFSQTLRIISEIISNYRVCVRIVKSAFKGGLGGRGVNKLFFV